MFKKILYFVIPILFVSQLCAQKYAQRPLSSILHNSNNIKSLVVDANKIKTILFNTGTISAPGVLGNVYDFTWNGLGYAYEIGLLAGAKVQMAHSTDSIAIISEGFGTATGNTSDGDFSPDGVTKWGFIPTKNVGDTNSTLIANNQDPSTWHPSWSKWPGKFGDAIADYELVYEMNDFSNSEFEYYPFPDDSTKRGLGITVESRLYQFTHPNLEDALFNTFEMTNSSGKKLDSMVLGIWGDPHIGGWTNFSDDASDFNEETQLFYSWDPDGKSDIPSIAPGYFGWTFYDTPSQKGITSFASFPYGGMSRPKNDLFVYNILSEGSFLSNFLYSSDPNNMGDFINVMGTGYFSLNTGGKTAMTVVYLFGYDVEELLSKSVMAKQQYDLRFALQGEPITITSPATGQHIQSTTIQIQWTSQTLDGDTTINIYYSNSPAEQWNLIAGSVPNNGSYEWNIPSLPDGAFYKIHLLKEKNGIASYDSTGGYFSLDHAGDAPPEISVLSPKNIKIVSTTLNVQWIARDAENDPIVVKVYCSDDNGSTYRLLDENSNTGLYSLDTRSFPNSYNAKIKIEATANGKSTVVETKPFRIANYFYALTDTSALKHLSGIATGSIFPGIADSSALTGNKYRISFDSVSGSLRYSLKNLTTDQVMLTHEPLTGINGSGALVDGMRIWFKNDPVGLDSARDGFNTSVSNLSVRYAKPAGAVRHAPIDLQVIFSSLDTNSSGAYLNPLDTVGTAVNPFGKIIPVPFKIQSLTDTSTMQYFIRDIPGKYMTGRWDLGEEIIVLTPPAYRTSTNNVHAAITFYKTISGNASSIPAGTIYFAPTTKPFTHDDVYEFTADKKYGQPTSVQYDPGVPKQYSLDQNYPNPFNPITHIRFSIASDGMTTLTVYDIMGREVKRIVNERLTAGNYLFEWDGTNGYSQKVSSGIYFYRMQSGSFAATMKMILLK